MGNENNENGPSRTKYGFIDLYHAKRRKEILEIYPEIRSLMIVDPSFKYVAFACAATQLYVAYLIRNEPLPFVLIMAVLVGTFYDCAITNSVHELIHDLAFESNPFANKVLCGFVNLPLVMPFAAGYHRTHRHHHSYLGTNLDAKYPPMDEALRYDQSIFGRIKFIFMHPLNGGERWTKYVPDDEPTSFVWWNQRTVWLSNAIIFFFFGYKSLLYLLLAFWINDCIFIQGSKNFVDHWVSETQTHTASYYGWINMINFNIGYHREHHDFPNIGGRYLKVVNRIAQKFYEDERYIAKSLFGEIWRVLTAEPGQGLTKYANKLTVREVAVSTNIMD